MSLRNLREADGDRIEKEPMLEWQVREKSRWSQYRHTIIIVLVTALVSVIGFVLLYHGFIIITTTTTTTPTPTFTAASSERTRLAGEVNGLVPEFPLSPQVWANNSLYGPEEDIQNLPQEEIDQLVKRWKDLMPRGYGFILVHKPEKYTLAPPLQYNGLPPPDYYYSISVFHQLHCLEAILQTFITDRTGFSHGAHDKRNNAGNQHFHHSRHILHCFDYLRQAIMCYGDTALEGADPYSIAEGRDQVTVGTSGIGTTHMCKNYEDIKGYAEELANPRWKRPVE